MSIDHANEVDACNCQAGKFCSCSNGPNSGVCELCSEMSNKLSCENDGLPALGVQ